MRILHLVNDLAIANGIDNVVVDLAITQRHLGHDVTVVSGGGDQESLLSDNGVRVSRERLNTRNPMELLKIILNLSRLVRALSIDVIHAHTASATVIACALPGGPPVVATVHNEWQRGAVLMGLAERVVGVSKAVTLSMKRRGIPDRKLRTVMNGVVGSPRYKRTAATEPMKLEHPAIVTVGRVCARKGSDVLFQAFLGISDQYSDAHLYYVGNRGMPELESDVRESKVRDRVHFEGLSSDPREYLKSCDIFVLPSRHDPMPLVLLESLDAGCSIVASSVDGIPETLQDGIAGLLFPSEDVASLSKCIVSLLEDGQLRATLSRNAEARSHEFSVAKMSSGYMNVYQELQ